MYWLWLPTAEYTLFSSFPATIPPQAICLTFIFKVIKSCYLMFPCISQKLAPFTGFWGDNIRFYFFFFERERGLKVVSVQMWEGGKVLKWGRSWKMFWPRRWPTVHLWKRTFYPRDPFSSPKNGIRMVKRMSVVFVCPRSIVPSSSAHFLNVLGGLSSSPQSELGCSEGFQPSLE